jgi:hypothetical protein
MKNYSEVDKQLYVELLDNVYVNSSIIGPIPKNLIPTMLTWKGDASLLNWDDVNAEEASKKLFSIASQPNVMNGESDWVSTWSADTGDSDLDPSTLEEEKSFGLTSNRLIKVTP